MLRKTGRICKEFVHACAGGSGAVCAVIQLTLPAGMTSLTLLTRERQSFRRPGYVSSSQLSIMNSLVAYLASKLLLGRKSAASEQMDQ
jgi:hypothetical protein